MDCLLCQTPHSVPFKVVKKPERSYFHCSNCDVIFMDPAERLSPQEEKARYDLHQNDETAGYSAFFEPLIKSVEEYFKAAHVELSQLSTLDYGCGPNPVLSKHLAAKGYKTFAYDVYYHPDQDLLHKNYHLITCTEVWEHFYHPAQEMDRLLNLLKPGGLLAVMTSAHRGEAAFHDWHYRRDLTHVVFFSEKSMNWISEKYRLQLLKVQSPYWLFQKMF